MEAQAPTKVTIPIPPICGVAADYLVSFEADWNINGGNFTAVFANEPEVPDFVSGHLVTLLGGYVGIVEAPSKGKGGSGNMIRVDGRITIPAAELSRPITYMNTDPWLDSDGQPLEYLNQLDAYKNDPEVVLLPSMRFIDVVSDIAAKAGLGIEILGEYINYRINKHVVSASISTYDAIQALCLPAGLNAVMGPSTLRLIPWEGAESGDLVVPLDIMDSDFSVTEIISLFNSVVVSSGSEMTPYNSCYIGRPEKIASLSFEAGPIGIQDISAGTGVIQADKQWFFPVDTITDDVDAAIGAVNQNSWLTWEGKFSKGSAMTPSSNHLQTALRLKQVWDYEFVQDNNIAYSTFFSQMKTGAILDTDSGLAASLANFTYTTSMYNFLVRWSHARTFIERPGDIHKFIYTIPSDNAPNELNFLSYEIPDTQELILTSGVNAQEYLPSGSANPTTSSTYFSSIPEEFRDVTPPGYGFNASFGADGSFFVDAVMSETRGNKYYIDQAITATKVVVTSAAYVEETTQGTLHMVAGQDTATVTNSNFAPGMVKPEATLAIYLEKLWKNRFHADVIIPTTLGVEVDPTGPSVIMQNVVYEDQNALDAFDAENADILNAGYIVSISSPLLADGSPDPVTANIKLLTAASKTYDGPFSFAKVHSGYSSIQFNRISSTGTLLPFSDSGLVEQNPDSIRASWSLYGITRKFFPAKCVASDSGFFTIHEGVADLLRRNPQTQGIVDSYRQRLLDTLSAKTTKEVSSDLITDTVGFDSHIEKLTQKLFQYVRTPHKAYSISWIAQNLELPVIGSRIIADGHSSKITGFSLKITRQGVTFSAKAGLLPCL